MVVFLVKSALSLLHFGYEDTPVERQYPCIEKQYEYEIYKQGATDDGAYRTDACKRKSFVSMGDHSQHDHHDDPNHTPCMYREQMGYCTILSMEYNNTEDDRMMIYVEYKPVAAKQRPEDLKQLLFIKDDLITEAYVKYHSMYMGMTTRCVRRVLRQGEDCPYTRDWLFPDIDPDRKGGRYGNSDTDEEDDK